MLRQPLAVVSLLALLGACTTPSDVGSSGQSAAALVAQTAFHGVYFLNDDTLDSATVDNIRDKAFVDGIALRTGWTNLDRGTTGPSYDFSSIVTAVGLLQPVGKKLSLAIDAQLVPPYVLDAAQTTYITTLPGSGG